MMIVLAYSGGLDTSVLLSWIKEKYNAQVIAFCADIGQEEELKGLEQKARKTGAAKVFIMDLQEEFARDFIFPMMQAGPLYEGQYFLGTSIARPLIAKGMIQVARKEKADALAHGATGKGNDQVRFELTAAALAAELPVIAPWRDASFRAQFPGRAEMIAYCQQKRIPVQASAQKPYSMDRNLLHISFEAGILEDPWMDAFAPDNKDMFKLSAAPEDAPSSPEYVTLDFEKGNCIALNGKPMSPLAVMRTLNKREVMHLRDSLLPRYAELVYYGYWFSPERLALQAFVTESQKNVTGTVRVKLYKGNIMISGRKSPVSLYHPAIATMEADPTQAYNQDDATGFIRLNALRLKVAAKVRGSKKAKTTRSKVWA